MEHVLIRLLIIFIRIALLLGSGLLLIWFYFRIRPKPVVHQSLNEDQKIILPLRLQAYERIVLLLERISPQNLILRINKPELTALQLQSALIKAIRDEFEYNLSQQLYISPGAWELVKSAKEEMISMINIASGKVPENSNSTELARMIIQASMEREKLPVNLALEEVKKELQKIF
jgi:hypothetical protein